MTTLTKNQEKRREKIVKAMKKNKDDFVKRYGDDAKSVMYATATKLAKEDVVDFSISFNNTDSARSFSNTLKEYTISQKDCVQTDIKGNASVFFEAKFDNYGFIQWLCEQSNALDITLCYENILPHSGNGSSGLSLKSFLKQSSPIDYDELFCEERIDEADDAYTKTKAYKNLPPKKKKAIDYFMTQIEKVGLGKLDRVSKDTTSKHNITANELDQFLETIFFAEDVSYIHSLAEKDEKEDDAETDEKKARTKTFDQFVKKKKSSSKKEKLMQLDKPESGSPIEDAEIDNQSF